MKCIVCGKPTALNVRLLCAEHYAEYRIPDKVVKSVPDEDLEKRCEGREKKCLDQIDQDNFYWTDILADDDMPDGAYFALAWELGEWG